MQRGLLQELRQGKSLGRTLMNLALQNITVSGQGIDLGAKSGDASYYRFLKVAPGTRIIFTDLYPTDPSVLRVDLERTLPIAGDSQDFLLLLNVLEHLFDFSTCLRECHRILRPGGRLIGAVPFLVAVHRDPDDHWRYTDSTLNRLLAAAGFHHNQITPLATGPLGASYTQLEQLLRPAPLRLFMATAAVSLDSWLARRFPGRRLTTPATFPLGYLFIATK